MNDNHDYYRRRADQERSRAAASEQPEIRRVHLELAALYMAKLDEAGQRLSQVAD